MHPKFKPGDLVKVKGVKVVATVISSSAQGEYEVSIGSFRTRCQAEALSPAEEPLSQSTPITIIKESPAAKVASRIDLHGKRAAEAVHAVADYLDRAVLSGMYQVEIVHGLGDGILRDAVHSFLKTLPTVKSFRINPYNPGTTFVYF